MRTTVLPEHCDHAEYAAIGDRASCLGCVRTVGQHHESDCPENADPAHDYTDVATIAAHLLRDGRAPSLRQTTADLALASIIGAQATVDAIMDRKRRGGRR